MHGLLVTRLRTNLWNKGTKNKTKPSVQTNVFLFKMRNKVSLNIHTYIITHWDSILFLNPF